MHTHNEGSTGHGMIFPAQGLKYIIDYGYIHYRPSSYDFIPTLHLHCMLSDINQLNDQLAVTHQPVATNNQVCVHWVCAVSGTIAPCTTTTFIHVGLPFHDRVSTARPLIVKTTAGTSSQPHSRCITHLGIDFW